MNIEYNIQIWQEGEQFVAHAMPLDVMSSGETPEQARQAVYEAVELFLETVAETGTLSEILQESGYALNQGNWSSPTWVAIERHSDNGSQRPCGETDTCRRGHGAGAILSVEHTDLTIV